MKLLAIADEEYDGSLKLPIGNYDLAIGCGDISNSTIERIIQELQIPFFGVAGNHDYHDLPPEANLHLTVKNFHNIKIGGFEGSWRYKPKGYHLYEEEEVDYLLKDSPYVDIFVAHNPPKGIHDIDDMVHNGFLAFRSYIERLKPQLFIHGHVHRNQETQIGTTRVISVYGGRSVSLPNAV